MSWVRLDDKVTRHPKLLACTVEARWLFVVCLCHCAEFGTDGLIQGANIRSLTAGLRHPMQAVDELVDNGLLEVAGVNGSTSTPPPTHAPLIRTPLKSLTYHVHDYLDYNPSKEQRIASARKAGLRSGQVRKQARSEFIEANVAGTTRSPHVPNETGTSRSKTVERKTNEDPNGKATETNLARAFPSRPLTSENKETQVRGDVHLESPPRLPIDLIAWTDWHQVSDQMQVGRVMDFLPGKRGDNQTLSPDRYQHELSVAKQIVQLAIHGSDLKQHLETWWAETDPDDRPASLEYFWTRFQQLENEALKQPRRSHVRTSGFSKAGEHLPDIQPPKGAKQ